MLGVRKNISRISNLPRYREVANILIKHGFGSVFDKISLRRITGSIAPEKVDKKIEHLSRPQRLRLALEELGPTFIKLGQLMSIRPDLLGPEYIKELEKLQDCVPAFSFEEIRGQCLKNGLDIEKDFLHFNCDPLAAASIAQVHEAVLKSGEEVVVKVQRPGIERIINIDLDVIFELSKIMEKRSSWGRLYHVSEIADELANSIRDELDFGREAYSADTFRRNFKNDPKVKIPRVYWEYSSSQVLTLEYLQGIKISDLTSLKQAKFNTSKIAHNLVDSLFKQIYDYGFFHADPHPGNIAISKEHRIIYYDFGQVGVIDQMLKEQGTDLLTSMIRYDVNGVTRALLSIAVGDSKVNREEFKRDIARLQQKYYGLPLSQIKLGTALAELMELSQAYHLRIPAELSLLVKMMMTIESIVSQLDPQISIVDIAEPYGRKLMMKRYSPENISANLAEAALDYARLFKTMPREIETLFELLGDGQLKVRMEHENLNRVTEKFDIMSNRLSLAIIISSIVIATALIVDKINSSLIDKIPLVEIGFITAMVLGLFLAYSIIRSGKY